MNSFWDSNSHNLFFFCSLEIDEVNLDDIIEDIMSLNIGKDGPESMESSSTEFDLIWF